MKNNNSTETTLSFPTFSKFFRWLFSWSIIRRFLITSAVVVTLVVSFYTVELVRGKRAWNNYVAEVEARGESLDIAALIPPPVPDDENFAMIPLLRDTLNFNKTLISKAPSNPSNTHGLKAFYKDSGEIRLQFSESLGNWIKGEKSGLVPNKSWKKKHHKQSWKIGETMITGVGQGFLTTTPIQLAVMIAMFANNGKRIFPTIYKNIKGVNANDNEVFTTQTLYQKKFFSLIYFFKTIPKT